MFRRIAVLALTLIAFNIYSPAQRDLMGSPYSQQAGRNGADTFNSLSGSVITSDNKPLQDVRVELRDRNGYTVSSVYTNSGGRFEFPELRAGTYNVVATLGVEEVQDRVDLGGTPSSVTLRMPVSSSANDGNDGSSVSVAQFKVPEKARNALKKAREASAKGKNDEAEKYLTKALEIYPKYADALTLRAILKIAANDQPGAIADLQQAITNDGNCAFAYLVMGSVFNGEAKFDDAIRALQRGEALAPSSWQGYFEMGKALVGKAQYEPALRQLDRAQALVTSDYPLIHLVKAHAMLSLNNYSDAMAELQAYLAKEPHGPNSEAAQKMLDQARAFSVRQGKIGN